MLQNQKVKNNYVIKQIIGEGAYCKVKLCQNIKNN